MPRDRRQRPHGILLSAVSASAVVQATTRSYDNRNPLLSYTPDGDWSIRSDASLSQGSGLWAAAPGATFECTFAGEQVIVLGSCTACEVRLDGEKATASSAFNTIFRVSNLDPTITHHIAITKAGTRASRLLIDEVRVAFLTSSGLTPALVNLTSEAAESETASFSSRTGVAAAALSTSHKSRTYSSTQHDSNLASALRSSSHFSSQSRQTTSATATTSSSVPSPVSASTLRTSSSPPPSLPSHTASTTPSAASASATAFADSRASDSARTRTVAGAVTGSIIGVLLLLVAVLFFIRRRRSQDDGPLFDFHEKPVAPALARLSMSEWTAYRLDGGNLPVGVPGKHFSGIRTPADDTSPPTPAFVPSHWGNRQKDSPSWWRLKHTRAFYRIFPSSSPGRQTPLLPSDSPPHPPTFDRLPATPLTTVRVARSAKRTSLPLRTPILWDVNTRANDSSPGFQDIRLDSRASSRSQPVAPFPLLPQKESRPSSERTSRTASPIFISPSLPSQNIASQALIPASKPSDVVELASQPEEPSPSRPPRIAPVAPVAPEPKRRVLSSHSTPSPLHRSPSSKRQPTLSSSSSTPFITISPSPSPSPSPSSVRAPQPSPPQVTRLSHSASTSLPSPLPFSIAHHLRRRNISFESPVARRDDFSNQLVGAATGQRRKVLSPIPDEILFDPGDPGTPEADPWIEDPVARSARRRFWLADETAPIFAVGRGG